MLFRSKGDTIEVVTMPGTDLWQRTYYHFRNDNAPVFQMETEDKYFSFVVKTDYSLSLLAWDDSKQKQKLKAVKKSRIYNRKIKVNVVKYILANHSWE